VGEEGEGGDEEDDGGDDEEGEDDVVLALLLLLLLSLLLSSSSLSSVKLPSSLSVCLITKEINDIASGNVRRCILPKPAGNASSSYHYGY
jgi:hypothetical protein